MGRILKLSIALVDDDRNFVRSICSRLNKLSKSMDYSEHWRFDKENPLELRFVPIAPSTKEKASSFKKRVAELILDNSDSGRIDKLAAIVVDLEFDMDNGASKFRGVEFAELARSKCPNLLRVLLTNYDPDEIIEDDHELVDWAQRKMSLTEEFGQKSFIERIVGEFRDRFEAPLWAGLKQYSGMKKVVLHAMANTDSRTRRRSSSIDNFVDFIGAGYFKAEASSTSHPLDSLLHPTGSIKLAEQQAAKAFGAHTARFVTNGTTTSNKIVHQTLCESGSQVLLDRFCHISHHYAVGMVRSWPVYLAAEVDQETEIPSQVNPKQIGDFLDNLLSRNGNLAPLPRLVAITNSTFDGFLLEPREIFVEVRRVLDKHNCRERMHEIAFLFDEAWFGFGRFHPFFSTFSAMTCREQLCREENWWDTNLRVYVTQSMHKTMTSFRQGSMILANDPKLYDRNRWKVSDLLRQKFDNAFAAHTTTSPHSGMLASIDIGRRQIVFEGRDLLSETISLANDFRNFIDRVGKKYLTANGDPALKVIDLSNLPSNKNGDQVDPTKITIQSSGWISGKELRAELWSEHGIQVNKYGPNTILCLFTIGVDLQALTDLKQEIQSFLTNNKTRIEGFGGLTASGPKFPSEALRYMAVERVDDALTAAISIDEDVRFNPGKDLFGEQSLQSEIVRLSSIIDEDAEYISKGFVVPYPPGYPILIPGQLVTHEIAHWLRAQSGREIHGLLTVEEDTAIAVRRT